MLKDVKMRDKGQHDMQIYNRIKDRPRAIHCNHQSKLLIMGLQTIYFTNIAKKITNKAPNTTRKK